MEEWFRNGDLERRYQRHPGHPAGESGTVPGGAGRRQRHSHRALPRPGCGLFPCCILSLGVAVSKMKMAVRFVAPLSPGFCQRYEKNKGRVWPEWILEQRNARLLFVFCWKYACNFFWFGLGNKNQGRFLRKILTIPHFFKGLYIVLLVAVQLFSSH